VREFVEFAVHLADLAERADPAALSHAGGQDIGMENKSKGGGFDPVTVADREAEAAIRREIRRVYPDHGILGEEHGFDAGASPYTWILDPIDGTRSFVLGQAATGAR
jgi:myo-inositol-1(or 4)-monophosphatase